MIISLGSTCSVGYQIRKHCSQPSLPFDWIRSNNFASICALLKNNFIGFFEQDEYIYLRRSDKFAVPDTEADSAIYKHHSYELQFFHDFHTNRDFKSQFVEFTQKMRRRVNRLFDILKDDSRKVLFIRHDLKPHRLSIDDVKHFCQYIDQQYPKLDYQLLIIINNPKNRDFSLLIDELSKIDQVTVHHDQIRAESWHHDHLPWPKFFHGFQQ